MRPWLNRRRLVLATLALVAGACGDSSTAGTVAADDLATPATTVAAAPAPSSTTLPAAVTTEPAGDEMAHDDDAREHDDGEAHHDAEEPSHDAGQEHEDDGVDPDDEMAHEEDADPGDETAHDAAVAAEFDREIEVVMTEFAFEPATISVTAGETVRFVLANHGAVPHEFRLTTAHAAAEHIASGHEGHDDGGDAGHGHDEVFLEVAAGATDHLTVTFDADAEWDQVACLIPGHYEAGMLGELRVS